MRDNVIYGVADRPSFVKSVFYGFQHLLACFGATVLVPMLVGIDPLYAIFTAGIGTLAYLFITGFKVPNFVGSSFAFIACAAMVLQTYGMAYIAGGALVSAVFYLVIALVVWKAGPAFINKILPPVVIGPVVAVIGLSLAGTAVSMSTMIDNVFSIKALLVALATLAITIIAMVQPSKFIRSISIVVGLLGGCIIAASAGLFHYETAGNFIHAPTFIVPKFNITTVMLFALTSFATICEHVGHTIVTGEIVGRDYVKDPGLHRTIAGDGIATGLAGLFGGVCNTTYGESLGVMATTKVHSVMVFVFAAVIAVVISFVQPLGDALKAIPGPVLGGVCLLLYGSIAVNGLKQLVINKVDFDKTRNLIIASVIFIIGCGGMALNITVAGQSVTLLNGIVFAAMVGIVLNLVLPKE